MSETSKTNHLHLLLRQYLGTSNFVIIHTVDQDGRTGWPSEWDIIHLRATALGIGVTSTVLSVNLRTMGVKYLFVVPLSEYTEPGIVMLKLKLSSSEFCVSEVFSVKSFYVKHIINGDIMEVETVYELQ